MINTRGNYAWAFLPLAGVLVLVCGSLVAEDAAKDGKDAKKPPETKTALLRLSIEFNAKDELYKVGQTAKFSFACDTSGQLAILMTEDGLTAVKEQRIRVQARQTYSLDAKLDRPGILRVELQLGEGRA